MYFKTELLIDSSILNGCVKKWPKYQNGQNALVLTALPVSSAGKCGGGKGGVGGGGGVSAKWQNKNMILEL